MDSERPVTRQPKIHAGALVEDLRNQWRQLRGKFATQSRPVKFLIVANALYVVLLLGFLWQFDESTLLKISVTLIGVALVAVTPELVEKKQARLRLFFICVPAIGIALVQFVGDWHNDQRQQELSRQLDARRLQEVQEKIRKMDSDRRETLVPHPGDTIDAIMNADVGFLLKADRLALQAASVESELLQAVPWSLVEGIMLLGDAPALRLQHYTSLAAAQVADPVIKVKIASIVRLLETELAYRAAAEAFVKDIKPVYRELHERAKNRNVDGAHLCQSLQQNVASLRKLASAYQLAGLRNQLGSIAMACSQQSAFVGHETLGREALSHFYAGLVIDNQHVPIYESLGYALWVVNDDSHGALALADEGMRLSKIELAAVGSEFASISASYDRLMTRNADLQKALLGKKNARATWFDKFGPTWTKFMQGMADKLNLQFAYFSALQLVNQNQARTIMKGLYESAPNDAEYEDSWGFILMRFARDRRDLDEAEKHFKSAIEKTGERITPGLAQAHLAGLREMRRVLEGRE